LGAINTGVELNGRAFTTTGALTTTAVTAIMTAGCHGTGVGIWEPESIVPVVTIYPNPFKTSLNIVLGSESLTNPELKLLNVLGQQVISTRLTKRATAIEISGLPEGIYLYEVIENDKIIQTGKLILQH